MLRIANNYRILNGKVIINIHDRLCETPNELFASGLFLKILDTAIKELERRKSILLRIFGHYAENATQSDIEMLVGVFKYLVKMPLDLIPNIVKGSKIFVENRDYLYDFVEFVYNYWRNFNRFIVCNSEGDSLDERPYRTFNNTIEKVTHLIRGTYRDLQENIGNSHPSVYRQVAAGAEVATIALPKDIPMPSLYADKLARIPVIRQVLLNPPLVLSTPNNKRSGQFERVAQNLIGFVDLNPDEWLCYPARVGKQIILVYFHEKFYELGFSLSNLFEIASDIDLMQKPDGIYLFGVQRDSIEGLGTYPTNFFDDEENDILVAACPNDDEFGYFGYLKKMMLTLYNIRIMKSGKMPFHGAMTRIILDGNIDVSILLIGDTGAGKSETLEAFRMLGGQAISDILIVADDMGSLEIHEDGNVYGYGTEIGAFMRIDDLSTSAAFGQIDRAIIMNANQINARIIIPVTTLQKVNEGRKVDYFLYANNYELVDEDHPVLEQFQTPEQAIAVFQEGTAMSKGTTTSTGLTHALWANIFGPPEYKDLHDEISSRFMIQLFNAGVFVGQMRTRLGIKGYEHSGPEASAQELL
ncbi:MAG TPA: hypothetical protein VKM55_18745 [Candidatus Lokiarchaeia archaeon]|nr:hypothetical protein [Candidatus Lokiarchaeia archaeon]